MKTEEIKRKIYTVHVCTNRKVWYTHGTYTDSKEADNHANNLRKKNFLVYITVK